MQSLSRWRVVLGAVAALGLIAALVLAVSSLDGDEQSILMLHTADSGAASSNGDGTFVLMVRGVDEVIWFTDHPDRRAGRMTVQALIELVEEAAAEDSLNATLEAGDFLYPVELLGAAPGGDEGAIGYIVRPLDEPTVGGPSELTALAVGEFGKATLFIDADQEPVNPQVTD